MGGPISSALDPASRVEATYLELLPGFITSHGFMLFLRQSDGLAGRRRRLNVYYESFVGWSRGDEIVDRHAVPWAIYTWFLVLDRLIRMRFE